MQQHTDAIKRWIAAFAGGTQKRRLERDVNNISGKRMFRQPVEPDVQRGFAFHSLAGYVHRHSHAVQKIVPVFPRMYRDGATEIRSQALGALLSAVDQTDVLNAFMLKGIANGATPPARTNDRHRSGTRVPVGVKLPEIAQKTQPVVIGAEQRSVFTNNTSST